MKKYTINSIKLDSSKAFLFDTNIWMPLLGEEMFESNLGGKTSLFLENLVENDCQIVIPSTVLSELFNRYMHNCYEEEAIKNGGTKNYKYKIDFRPSKIGKERKDFFIMQMLDFLVILMLRKFQIILKIY